MRAYCLAVLLVVIAVFCGCGGDSSSPPPPVISVSVTPATANVPTSGTQQFNASVTGSSNKAVSWSVAGAGCSGASCGTIDATGLYVTPAAAPSPGAVTVTATSQADTSKSGSATVTVVDSHNARMNGRYAFLFKGFDANGGVASAGSFHADGLGHLTDGVQDVNRFSGVSPSISFTGTYLIGTDDRGTFTLTSSLGSVTYTFSLDGSGEGRFIELDASASRGSGIFKQQDSSSFSTAGVSGDYAFGFTGLVPSLAAYPLSEVGRFHADGAGTLSGGEVDLAVPGSIVNSLGLSGSYALPSGSSDGRGTALFQSQIPGTNGLFNFVFYIVSQEEQFFVSLDAPTEMLPLLSGRTGGQPGGAFSNAALSGAVIFNQIGPTVVPSSSVSIGEITSDGAGKLSGMFDQNDNGTISSSVTFTGNYSIAANGRGVLNFIINPPFAVPSYFYMAGNNRGFLLLGPAMNGPSQALSGSFGPQSGGPFGTSLLDGNFFFGSITPATSNTLSLAGVMTMDSSGGVSGTADIASSEGNAVGQAVAGNYAVAADGRGTLTLTSPGASLVFYALSPQKLVAIDMDADLTESPVLELEK